MREIIRWTWLVVCIAEFLAALLAWLELRRKRDRSFYYLSRVMFSDALRAAVSAVGLYLFGVNVQTHLWFLALGLISVVCQGISTVGWLLYVRNLINGGGWWGLLKRDHRQK